MENKIYRSCHFRMSQKAMANIMYALIMTRSTITSTFTLGRGYTREQNSYNGADIMIEMTEDNIQKFEELSGMKLEKPIQIQLN